MIKKIFLLFFTFILSFASEDISSKEFFDNILKNIKETADSNISDQLKLEQIQSYVQKLKRDKKTKNKEVVNKNKVTEKKKTANFKIPNFDFNLMSHKDNFLILGSYSPNNLIEKHWDSNGIRDYSKDYKRGSSEAQFQISLKFPLVTNIFDSKIDLYAAYTQNSFWQVYDKKHSRPFRETNYSPELFFEYNPSLKFNWATLEKVRLSFIHQSNGQDIGYSRSWNRTEAMAQFKTNKIKYGFCFWDRWDEKERTTPSSSSGDDNPLLEEYLGKQKLFLDYKYNHYGFSLEHNNNLFKYNINKGNTKIDIDFPSINESFNFFIRYFNGYAESLIDYDIKLQRVGFGIKVHNWK